MIGSQGEKKVMRYDEIKVGEEFPPLEFMISEDRVRDYQKVFEDNYDWLREGEKKVPPFVSSMDVIAPIFIRYAIAPGTIHAKQELVMLKAVKPGTKLISKSRVSDKYIKRDKKYVVFETLTKDEDGNPVNINRFHFVLPE